jgi:transposase
MSSKGILAPLIFEGACDGVLFDAYVEQVLLPELVAGQIVILDNLSVHKKAKVRQLSESKGCELWFLPTYLPDLSPIELAFAQRWAISKTSWRTDAT